MEKSKKRKSKRIVYAASIAVVLAILVLLYQIPINTEYIEPDSKRQIGTVDASQGSPIMGASDAPNHNN